MKPIDTQANSPQHGDSHLPRIPIEQLVKNGRAAILVHDDKEYRLQVTRNKKLILTR